jgi:hypothetical protein
MSASRLQLLTARSQTKRARRKALAFGFFLSGMGEAWVSGVKIEEVGMDVKSTAIPQKSNLPATPVNLGFALSP